MQHEGLQRQYNDPGDRSIKIGVHMICAIAFVPINNVQQCFEDLEAEIPEEVLPIYKYFEETYIKGRPAVARRGRGRPAQPRYLPPRYPPALWSQYDATLQRTARTNNISEGWHNKFQIVVGKNHPSLYMFLTELKKEQADTEIMYRQLQLGQKIRKNKDSMRKQKEERLFNITNNYHNYVENNDIMSYLRNIGSNVRL